MLTYFGLVGYGGACCARRWLCSHVLKVLRFLSSLMPGGREFHTVLLRVVVYVVRAVCSSACFGLYGYIVTAAL